MTISIRTNPIPRPLPETFDIVGLSPDLFSKLAKYLNQSPPIQLGFSGVDAGEFRELCQAMKVSCQQEGIYPGRS